MLQGSKGLGTTGTIGRIGTIVINIIVIIKIWIWKYSSYEDLISLKSYTIFLFYYDVVLPSCKKGKGNKL